MKKFREVDLDSYLKNMSCWIYTQINLLEITLYL